MNRISHCRFALFLLATIVFSVSSAFAESQIVLKAEPYGTAIIERIPVVARLTIENKGARQVMVRFSSEDTERISQYSSLVLSDGEHEYRFANFGEVQGTVTAIPPVYPLESGERIVSDRLIFPFSQKPMGRIVFKNRIDRYDFIPPGKYEAHYDLDLGIGEIISSNVFELHILKAENENLKARDMIKKEHVRFFEGADPPPSESFYKSGGSWNRSDLSRFREIQDIVDEAPNTQYAEWVRFWKVYHHGSVDEGIEYARAHREFPLADNLFLHKVQELVRDAGKSDSKAYDHADELLDELWRDFPGSDTKAASQALKDRISLQRGK